MFRLPLALVSALLFAVSFARADPSIWRAQGWKTDFSKTSINLSEVLSGGQTKDGIPPIDNPKFIEVSAVSDLGEREPVIGLEINGDARAYPLRVMTWHEIVNDRVGGVPVAVTYCPLCNSAVVFDARIDGRALSFGTTGKLRNSDLVMYDRSTESWWQQFVGEGIAGTYTGRKLKLVAARLESWTDFRTRHPDGKVLVANNPWMRNYGRNPYVNYDISRPSYFYTGSMPEGISPMARVVVVRRESKPPIVIALQKLRDSKTMVRDGIKIGWKVGQNSALHAGVIAEGRDVGSVSVSDATSGRDLVYDVTFAFVAHAFHPETTIEK